MRRYLHRRFAAEMAERAHQADLSIACRLVVADGTTTCPLVTALRSTFLA